MRGSLVLSKASSANAIPKQQTRAETAAVKNFQAAAAKTLCKAFLAGAPPLAHLRATGAAGADGKITSDRKLVSVSALRQESRAERHLPQGDILTGSVSDLFAVLRSARGGLLAA